MKGLLGIKIHMENTNANPAIVRPTSTGIADRPRITLSQHGGPGDSGLIIQVFG